MITTFTDLNRDLTTHKVEGDVADLKILDIMELFAPTATLRVLWDLRDTYSISSISSDHTDSIISHLTRIPVKKDGRSAFVFSSQSDYGIGRMYETYARAENLPFEVAVFENMDHAETWLDELDGPKLESSDR